LTVTSPPLWLLLPRVLSAPFHGHGSGEKDQFLWRTIERELSFLCRENRAESQTVDELGRGRGTPFKDDVVTAVEHADNDEKKRSAHT
jgi:hypothetical protein